MLKQKSEYEQQVKLAELIVNYQAAELKKPGLLQHQMIRNKISIKELVTSKKTDQIFHLTINEY